MSPIWAAHRLRSRVSRAVAARRSKNAVCASCGYVTFQSRWRNVVGWTACPACWEEGGRLTTIPRVKVGDRRAFRRTRLR